MTPNQFRAALSHLGFAVSDRVNDEGISAFARWLPCSLRCAGRWSRGEGGIPPAVVKLLLTMVRLKLSPDSVARIDAGSRRR